MPVQRAGFGPTLALTATLALGSAVAAISLLILVTEPKPLPAPLAGEQNQDVETALYVIVFALILPLALVAGPRIADRVAAGPNGAALPGLTALLGAGLAAAILAVRFSGGLPWEDGVGATLGAVGIWAAAVSLLLVGARNRARPRLLGICRHPERLWALTAALGLGVLVGLTDPGLSWPVAAVVGLAIPALVAIRRRRPAGPLPRGWGGAFDGAVIALLILAIPDLVIFRPEESSGDFAVSFETFVIQFHHNFLLGPANEVLAGGAVLVDTASQYGVAPLYLISGWFQLAPAGYGTLGLLDGAVTALAFAAAYSVLRICGCNRPLAAGAIAIGVVALAYNLSYPVGGLPEQGQLRFGLPMALIAFTVAGLRWPRWVRLAGCGALATIGLTSIWSLEAFAVTAATAIAIGAVHAWLLPAGSRRGWIGRATALAAISCLAAHLILAAATLAAAGELPDWGQYLAYLEGFLFGKLGEITYDFAPWSPALAVGAGYLTSAIAIALLVRRRPELVRREPISMIALSRRDRVRDRPVQLLRRPLRSRHPPLRRAAGLAHRRALAGVADAGRSEQSLTTAGGTRPRRRGGGRRTADRRCLARRPGAVSALGAGSCAARRQVAAGRPRSPLASAAAQSQCTRRGAAARSPSAGLRTGADPHPARPRGRDPRPQRARQRPGARGPARGQLRRRGAAARTAGVGRRAAGGGSPADRPAVASRLRRIEGAPVAGSARRHRPLR